MESEFIIRKGFISRADSKISGSLELTGSLNASGSAFISGSIETPYSITGSDVQIDDWGSVSASLSAVASGATSITLQDVTDNGNTTTNTLVVGGLTSSGNFEINKTVPAIIMTNSGSGGLFVGPVITLRSNTWGTAGANTTMGSFTVADEVGIVRGGMLFNKATSTSSHLEFYNDSTGVANLVISSSGNVDIKHSVTASDAYIDDWGSVSASLASVSSGATSITLQDVTDNGNTTTNDIYISSSKSLYLGANSTIRRELNSGGYENIQLNGSIFLKPNTAASANNGVVIGGNGYLLAPNSSRNAQLNYGSVSGQLGVYRLNVYGAPSTFQYDVNVTGAVTASNFKGDLVGNAATATTATSASYALSSSYAVTASYVAVDNIGGVIENASTASYVEYVNVANKPTLVSGSSQINLSQATGTAATATSASSAGTSTLVQSGNATFDYDGYLTFFASSQTDGQLLYKDASNLKYNPLANKLTLTGSLEVTEGITATVSNATNATYAQNVTVTGKNLSAGTIAKGTPLYFTGSGTSGNLVGIYPADADNPARMPAGGIAGEAITTGNEGLVLISGWINGVDTSAFNAGDQVYVAGGGGYTKTPPTGSALVQKLGNVEKVDSTNGSGVINGPGAVRSVPNIASGFTWVGDGDSVATPTAVSTLSVASAVSASYAATADAVGTLNQDVTVNGNLTVFGTASFTSVTSSQLIVDDSFIAVNVFEPAERFGGLRVYDSGSLSHQATASLAWDSTNNRWIYQNASGSMYSGGMFLSGPRNTGSLGDEPSLTRWYVARGDGGDHLNDSQIYSSGSITIITGSLTTTGKVTVGTVDNHGADPDKFLAIVNGEIVYRTGTQLLSDIGGQQAIQDAASGTGSLNYVTKWTGTNSIGTSILYDNGNYVGIGTTNPVYKLDVSGSDIQVNGARIGKGPGNFEDNVVFGIDALASNTTGEGNIAIGYKALTNTTTNGANVAIGSYTGENIVGDYNFALGASVLQASGAASPVTANQNTLIGAYAAWAISQTSNYNTAVGSAILQQYDGGSSNTIMGQAPLYYLKTGDGNTVLGRIGMLNLLSGSNNTALGNAAGGGIVTGSFNTIIGANISGLSSTLNNNIILADGQGNIRYRYQDGTTTLSGPVEITGGTDVVFKSVSATGTSTITPAVIDSTSYDGLFFDYIIVSGVNRRAGTLTVVWSDPDLEWKDVSTLDLGDTTGAEFTPVFNGTDVEIELALPSGTWRCKGTLRYM